MEFLKLNRNPKGWKTNDCVIRAISKATNYNWGDVYVELTAIGLKKCRMPNDKIVYESWLKENGWKKKPMPKKANGKRYTVEEFIKLHTKGTFIINVAKHVTVVIDSVLIDTWNCSEKSVGNYYIKKETEKCMDKGFPYTYCMRKMRP